MGAEFLDRHARDGANIRLFTLVDVHTRECVTPAAAPRSRGQDVALLLNEAVEHRGALPPVTQVGNGTGFTSKALNHWAYWSQGQLDFSRPAKPVDNCVIEAFDGSLRRECLSQHRFASLAEAQHELARWQEDYNNHRPHRSLGNEPPACFARGGHYVPSRARLSS
ncbi:MAG TPA: integrase core domain-containing protein [Gemmatimonadales bacterium]|nr:integrase core domain-containing protein [Gemmatimonadales bacterium]